MRAARSPSPASRAQDYKLGGPPEERRYTCPSYELERTAPGRADWPTADRVDLPGFRPVEAYEAALANIAPELTRRPDPETVEEVLDWAGMPLATAEVAAVCDRTITDVREELAHVAAFAPVGGDGYWTRAPYRPRMDLREALPRPPRAASASPKRDTGRQGRHGQGRRPRSSASRISSGSTCSRSASTPRAGTRCSWSSRRWTRRARTARSSTS